MGDIKSIIALSLLGGLFLALLTGTDRKGIKSLIDTVFTIPAKLVRTVSGTANR